MNDAPLDGLERQRAHLYDELAATGDFRRGSISENYRRCGKPNCVCAQPDHPAAQVHYSSGQEWFASVKQYCNAVEAELAQRNHPAPQTIEGQGYSAACYALGGKIDLARARKRPRVGATAKAACAR